MSAYFTTQMAHHQISDRVGSAARRRLAREARGATLSHETDAVTVRHPRRRPRLLVA